MPPKRKARSSLASSTPNTPTPAGHDEDSMAVDTPQTSAVDTPRTAATPFNHPKGPSEEALMQNVWTEDEQSALLSAVIIWPPKGMHRHFRILAISEHLRNRGINPDIRPHTRIPGIWKKLREFFNLDFLDEREDKVAFDGEDPEHLEEKYNDFALPDDEYIQDLMWKRRLPSPSSAGSSPPAMDLDDPKVMESLLQQSQSSATGPDRKGKRKRGDSVAATGRKTRSSTVEDTEEGTPLPTSSPVAKGGRGGRGRTRASTRTKAEDTEQEDSEDHDGDEEEEEEEEEESTHERAASTARHTRGSARGRGGRGRGRPAKRGRGR